MRHLKLVVLILVACQLISRSGAESEPDSGAGAVFPKANKERALHCETDEDFPNVALNKPVYGNLLNKEYITDGNVMLDAKGENAPNPFWFIDLGGYYKIHAIRLYTSGNVVEGYSLPFGIYSWNKKVAPDDMASKMPWKRVAHGLKLNQAQSVTRIKTEFEARYIIVRVHSETATTQTMSELMVFGEEVVGGGYGDDKAETFPNVALNKPVYGNLLNKNHITDGNLESDAVGQKDHQPFWYIDLGAVYKIHVLRLYNKGDVMAGFSLPFTIYYWNEYVSPCEVIGKYPWKSLLGNIELNQTRSMVRIKGAFEAQYIIIMVDRKNELESAETQSLTELMAFGEKLRDTHVPDYSEDPDPTIDPIMALRRRLSNGQELFHAEAAKGEYVPDYDLLDVALGWIHMRVHTMAATRGKGRLLLLSGIQAVDLVVSDAEYEPIRSNVKGWLAEGQTDPKFEKVSDAPTKGAMLLITRDDKFDVDRIHQLIISGENSAIFGYVHATEQEDDATALLAKLGVHHIQHPYQYSSYNFKLVEMMYTDDFIPPWIPLKMALHSWKALTRGDLLPPFSPIHIQEEKFQALLKQILEKYADWAQHVAPCVDHPQQPDGQVRAAMYNYNKLITLQTTAPLKVLPGSSITPGYVSPAVKPTSHRIHISTGESGNDSIPVGAWAKAGEVATYEIIESSQSDLSGLAWLVNSQMDVLQNVDTYTRWPILSTTGLLEQKGKIPTAIGGPIFLSLPSKCDLTIEFNNVYQTAQT